MTTRSKEKQEPITQSPSYVLPATIRADGEYAQLLETIRRESRALKPRPILANGLCEGAQDALLVSLLNDTALQRAPCALLLCAEEKDCVRLCAMFRRFGLRAAFFVGRDYNFHNIAASHDYEHERLEVLFGIQQGTLDVVLTTPDAALGFTIPPDRLSESVMTLDFSTQVETDALAEKLVRAGYTRVGMVDGKGQFAVRGGIVDIYPTGGVCTDVDGTVAPCVSPVRIELFDNEIDRMGLFDIDTQRINTPILQVILSPAKEVLPDHAALTTLKKVLTTQQKATTHSEIEDLLQGELSTLEDALEHGGELLYADKYISLIYPEKCCLLSYFTARTMIVQVGTAAVRERLKGALWHADQTVKDLVESGTIAPKYAEYTHRSADLDAFLDKQVTLHVDSMSYGLSGQTLAGIFGFRSKQMVSFGDNYDLLFDDLSSYTERKYHVYLLAENETAGKNLCGLLQDKGYDATLLTSAKDSAPGKIVVLWNEYLQGFELVSARIAVLSTNPETRAGSVVGSGKIKSKKKKKDTATKAILSYAELEVGDLVVHEDYGIGCYTGIETLQTGGATRDYIGIQYAGSDKLFLPTEKMDKVSKYIGAHADDGLIKLSKLGTDSWGRAKAKAKASVKDIAKELIQLYAERSRRPGYAYPADDDFQRSFESAFDYEETECQLRAAEEVKADMCAITPMDRLLCGDVGFGKTEVAMRAAYKAVMGGKQVAVLVPTTILALQHFQTFTSRMRAFGVNVDMISRFRER